MTATIVLTPPEHQGIARQVADVLDRHYPNHPWYVEANSGVVKVKNPALTVENGFVLHMPHLKSASDLARGVVWAGGEFLERFNIRRGKHDRDLYPEHLAVSR